MKKIIVIPSRIGSTRLPRKPLCDIGGQSLIERTYKQALKSKLADEVYIATDSNEILEHCKNFTENVLMTDANHKCGTDRVAEVAESVGADIVMNVQGDEPFVDPEMLDALFKAFDDDDVYMASAMGRFKSTESLQSPNTVNVVVDKDNYALYFSRSILPYCRDDNDLETHLKLARKHIGVYAFRNDFLQKFTQMPQTFLEKTEMLEQLRALENGFKIKMIETDYASISVDTQEDLDVCRKIVAKHITSYGNE